MLAMFSLSYLISVSQYQIITREFVAWVLVVILSVLLIVSLVIHNYDTSDMGTEEAIGGYISGLHSGHG